MFLINPILSLALSILFFGVKLILKLVVFFLKTIISVFTSGKKDMKYLYSIDGDTIVVEDSSKNKKVIRLIGIDAFETTTGNRAFKQAEFFGMDVSEVVANGEKAKKFIRSLLVPGEKLKIEFDAMKYDKYGRLLAYVFKQNGTMLNKTLVEKGHAFPCFIEPNTKYARTISSASYR